MGTAGDVNGDGFSDVLVGAPGPETGAAFLYLGSSAGLQLSPAWNQEIAQVDAFFGGAVGTAGDVNGDGFSDFIVSAFRYDGALNADIGAAWVFAGSDEEISGNAIWQGTSGQTGAEFGISAGTAGDVDGDGFSDILVSAYRFDNGQEDEGRVFVYSRDALDRVPQQRRMDNSRIEVLGRTDDPNQFRLRMLGRTPAGRGRVRIEGEVQPYGTPFAGGSAIFREQFEDTGTPGPNGSATTLAKSPGNLDPSTLYCWRVRTASDSPFFPRSPWFTLAGNALTEADLRTSSAGTSVAEASPGAGGSWLEPCAPNPFTIATRLAYTLPERGPVRLAVYDVSGREVLVLADEVQDAGRYATHWDGRNAAGRNAPAGVYFARLNVGGHVEARKIVLAR